jgi:NADH dehydrogenase
VEDFMARQTVTVFGGSGFLGRYVVARLAKDGWIIRVAVRYPSQAAYLKTLGDVGQVTPVHADLNDPTLVETAVAGADAVVNLVGILYESRRQSFAGVHHQGAERIAAAVAAAGIGKMVQVSAIGASASSPSIYARTKAAGEAAVQAALPSAVILRPSLIFGPEDDFFNRFAKLARFWVALPLIGGGKTKFQPVYVADVADAVVKALSDPACRGQTYELGGPSVYSFKQLMEILLANIGRRRLLLPLPFEAASAMARVLELSPFPPLTRDQVELLKSDNVVAEGAKGFAELGIEPRSAEVIVPTYLDRHRPHGRYDLQSSAS